MRLLLVEDSDRLRKNLARALSRLGHAVDEMADGDEAAKSIGLSEYDVVILDLMLPGMNGPGVAVVFSCLINAKSKTCSTGTSSSS